jgi:hypothetical protein
MHLCKNKENVDKKSTENVDHDMTETKTEKAEIQLLQHDIKMYQIDHYKQGPLWS